MRLLVSVVSAEEARRALAGGANIIDVKDPNEGSLGAPSPRILSEVVREVGGAAPVSVALGDLPNLPHTAALAARGAALSGADYVKVGLRGVRELDDAVALVRAVADALGPRNRGDRGRLRGRRRARSAGSRSRVAARTGGARGHLGRARRHVRQGRPRPVSLVVRVRAGRPDRAHARRQARPSASPGS